MGERSVKMRSVSFEFWIRLFNLEPECITYNKDGSIDYDGDVRLWDKNLTEIPFNFRYVSGHFDCSYNKLKSLKGAPQKVGGGFSCYNNNLTSLKGAPQEVSGYFDCAENNLTSLKGAPKEVGESFYCSNNPNLPQSEKDSAEQNIKAKEFIW